jgi:predicted nucleic acid-binding protein
MRLVLDAGVAIASLRPRESGHHAARARLRRIAAGEDVAVVPALRWCTGPARLCRALD